MKKYGEICIWPNACGSPNLSKPLSKSNLIHEKPKLLYASFEDKSTSNIEKAKFFQVWMRAEVEILPSPNEVMTKVAQRSAQEKIYCFYLRKSLAKNGEVGRNYRGFVYGQEAYHLMWNCESIETLLEKEENEYAQTLKWSLRAQ